MKIATLAKIKRNSWAGSERKTAVDSQFSQTSQFIHIMLPTKLIGYLLLNIIRMSHITRFR